MRPNLPPPVGHPGSHPVPWLAFQAAGIAPSSVLVVGRDGRTTRWRAPAGTPAHLERHPVKPDLWYLSCHEVALALERSRWVGCDLRGGRLAGTWGEAEVEGGSVEGAALAREETVGRYVDVWDGRGRHRVRVTEGV